MDKQTLDLLIKLQPAIVEAMGPWLVGDRCLVDGKEWIVVFVYMDGVTMLPVGEGLKRVFCLDDPAIIRIPLPLPLPGQSVKRTLWGMVDWGWKEGTISMLLERGTGRMKLFLNTERHDKPIVITESYIDPYLALLKAIEAQEGVK